MSEREDRRAYLAYEIQRLLKMGRSQRQIARGLGIARKTVKKVLGEIAARRDGETDTRDDLVKPRAPRASKIDLHHDRLRRWLEEDRRLTATRCLELLREEGFEGGYSIVRERVKQIRAELHPKAPAQVMEYVPGQRAEFDWSPYDFAWGRVQVWNATLSWSHATHAVACLRTRQSEILRCLRASFEAFGGVPQECITDGMPGVVDRWECERPIINRRFLAFAVHYDFRILAAKGKPTAKPHAERFFLYVQENFLPGRTFPSFESFAEQLAWWQRERAQVRPHAEKGDPITQLLGQEQAHLQPLPRAPYDTRDVLVRVVDPFGYVRLETNRYPVPAAVGELVFLCVDQERLEVCDQQARRLIEHERLADGAGVQLDQLPQQKRRDRYDLDELVERIAEWGDVGEAYATRLRQTRRYPGPQLAKVLQLQLEWSLDDLLGAMQHAMDYHCYDVEALRRILETRYKPRSLDDRLGEASRQHIRTIMQDHPVQLRPPSTYRSLREGDPRAPSPHGSASTEGRHQAPPEPDEDPDQEAPDLHGQAHPHP